MSVFPFLSSLAVKGVAAAGEALGFKEVGEGADGAVRALAERFFDHSKRLTRALHKAGERSRSHWRASRGGTAARGCSPAATRRAFASRFRRSSPRPRCRSSTAPLCWPAARRCNSCAPLARPAC